MKLILILISTTAFNGLLSAQDCRDRIALRKDIDKMYELMSNLNRDILDPFKKDFQDDAYPPHDSAQYAARIETSVNLAYASFPQLASPAADNKTCFCYHLNKEANDYLFSLNNLKKELSALLTTNGHRDVFFENRYIVAYNQMTLSRSLLMAAMDNLQRHHVVLDSAAHSKSELIKSIAESEERITTKISESEKRVRKTTRSWGLAATGSALVVTIIILIHSRE